MSSINRLFPSSSYPYSSSPEEEEDEEAIEKSRFLACTFSPLLFFFPTHTQRLKYGNAKSHRDSVQTAY